MKRLLGFALSLIVAWLCAVTVAGPALAAPSPDVASIYDYDGQHHTAAQTDTTTERGPPAIAFDYTVPHLAVDAASYGPLVCPRTATTLTYTGYDHLVQHVQVAEGPGTTLTEAGARKSNTRADLGARCGAKSGTECKVGSVLETVDDVMANPSLLRGRHPALVENILKDTPGWRVEKLGGGSQAGHGWVFRQYIERGHPTGPQLRRHPGGGHHGPDAYWRVVGSNGDLGGIIR